MGKEIEEAGASHINGTTKCLNQVVGYVCRSSFCNDHAGCFFKRHPELKNRTEPQSAEEGIDCYYHSTTCYSVICEQHGCSALKNGYSLPVKKVKPKYHKTKKPLEIKILAPAATSKASSYKKEELSSEDVIAVRLKDDGKCTRCGHYNPCRIRCFKHK